MDYISENSTIAAISTGLTESGISIVRVSGPKAVSIVDSIFKNKNGIHNLSKSGSHKLNYGFLYNYQDNGNYEENRTIIDEVLVSVMYAPHTYTGEDIVEINCHGGIYVTSLVLQSVLDAGAVLADAGEFTKRAFLNGRIDLARAEAVMDLISSDSEISRKVSLGQLKGELSGRISEYRKLILSQVSFIEAALDDPEHYDFDDFSDSFGTIIDDLCAGIVDLIDSYREGAVIKNGVSAIILGKPNVGKSSILNLLSGTDRAIVTDIAGTTRDIIEQDIKINSISVNLLDTAGIRNTDDKVERIGIDKTLSMIDSSNLIFFVCDASTELDEDDERILGEISDTDIPVIFILNKTDLGYVTSREVLINKILECGNINLINDSLSRKGSNLLYKGLGNLNNLQYACDNDNFGVSSSSLLNDTLNDLLNKRESNMFYRDYKYSDFEESSDVRGSFLKNNYVNIIDFSVKESKGLTELKDAVKSLFFSGNIDNRSDRIIITNQRHLTYLKSALESLDNVKRSIEMTVSEDFYTIDLMDAYKSLGFILGEEVGDDLVNEIFSSFCMGK